MTRGSQLLNKVLVLLVIATVAGVTLGGLWLAAPEDVRAQSGPSATRSFSATSVAPGDTVTVTITATNANGFGQISDTVPDGFDITTPEETGQTITGQTIKKTFLNLSEYSYTVTAKDSPGTHTFAGTITLLGGDPSDIGGGTTVTITGTVTEPEPMPSATRSISPSSVRPGADFTVTIVADNYGVLGRIVETVPEGFATEDVGQTVTFRLLQAGPQTKSYTVTAPETTGDYMITGTLEDSERNIHMVTGATRIRVRVPAPAPPPSPPAPDPGPDPDDPCLDSLSGDGAVSGTWSSGCESTANEGSYARYYSFTLGESSDVTIDLESDADTYLYLRAGGAKSGDYLHENDDVESGNLNSQIAATLGAGTYTIEATTYNAGETGSFTLTVTGLGDAAMPGDDPCLDSLSGDGAVSGTWSSGCESTANEGSYARYYSFTLGESSDVTIDLESDADTYLYLRAGGAKSGDYLHENDDVESGNLNSQIAATLGAGTYTIEATTYNAGETGSFTLTVTGLGDAAMPGDDPCLDSLSGDGAVSGTWSSGCESTANEGSYARYYSFTLGESSDVTIDLESDADTYLYLRAGGAKSGDYLHENDDVESGNLNSQIAATLGAGTYTIEATTYDAGETGSFTLTVGGL